MNGSLEALGDCFVQIDVPPPGGPGHFAFFLPTDEAYRKWPHYPAAARPEAGRVGSGRGLSAEDCRASGLGEAIERASCCTWPDENLILAPIDDVQSQALLPGALLGFSPTQITNRVAWNATYQGIDWCPPEASATAELAWCRATHALTGSGWLVPADFVLIGARSRGDAEAVAVATSSGCAAGPTIEAARLSAILELIERDAVGRWWYGARRRALVEFENLGLDSELTDYLRDRDRRTVLLDISTDLWSPIFAAASWEMDGTHVALGFAAQLTRAYSAQHALTEMLQIEIGIGQRVAMDEPDIITWCHEVTTATPPLDGAISVATIPEASEEPDYGTGATALARVLEACTSHGIEVFFIDRTRPEFNVPVVRAIAPGLCSDKPRWGWSRLLAADPNDLKAPSVRKGGQPPNLLPLRV